MAEITNDARTVLVIEDARQTFDVETGGRSGTPTLEVPVIDGNLVEVTCQFMAKNPDGGFEYEIKSLSKDGVDLTAKRGASRVENSAGWQSCVRTDYFLTKLQEGEASDDVTFEVSFTDGGMSNPGQAGAFLMCAKIVGSKRIP